MDDVTMNVQPAKVIASMRVAHPFVQSLESTRLRIIISLAIFDLAAIFVSFSLTGVIYQNDTAMALQEAVLISPLMLMVSLHSGLYKADILYSLRRALFRCLYVIVISAIFFILFSFFTKTTASYSRFILIFGCVTTFLSMIFLRFVLQRVLKRIFGPTLNNTLIVYAGGPTVEINHAYFINAEEHDITPDPNDPTNLDRLGRFMVNMDRVIISCPLKDRDAWTPILRAAGVEGEFVSTELWRLGALKIQTQPDFCSVVVSSRPLGLEARIIKRTLDVLLSVTFLIALSPIFLITAFLIKLDDGGPVFFIQERMGTGNRLFFMYKFRSMKCDFGDLSGRRSTSRADERFTKVGKFIRRTSIDELPQLLNVLKGEMSLVGPRPHALGSQAGDKLFWEIDRNYWNRHALKPGLTGLAQTRGLRGATFKEKDLSERLQSDLEYIDNWSIFLDLKILAKTVFVLMHHRAF